MNRGSHVAAPALFAGTAAASFFLVTFNTGWLLRDASESLLGVLIACILLVPVAVMLVGSVNDQARRVLALVLLCSFEACSYVVVMTLQNAAINTSFIFYTASITWYALMLASALSIIMLSTAELGKVSRSVAAWPFLACVALAVPGFVMAASLAAGFAGWVQNVLVAMILQPAGLLFFLLGSPPAGDPGVAALLDADAIRSTHVVHPLKGGYLTLYNLLIGVNTGLLVGVNGIGLDLVFFLHENYLFYASIGIGAAAGATFSYFTARKLLAAPGSARKDRDARLFLLCALVIQILAWSGAAVLEILGDGFHGTLPAQLLDGTVVGIILILQLAVVLVHHPPRAFMAHLMLPVLCMGFFIAFGQVIKAIPLGSAGLESVQDYLQWFFIAELVIVAIIVLLSAIPNHRKEISSKGDDQ
ncbi:MAG: hypothetical protein GYA24_06365 [Candidatus Lokiarchaeota archaeon]|nr:hypothetical protein [Candidatus Lokiarchaeota archaeon]